MWLISIGFVWRFFDDRLVRTACCSVNPGRTWQCCEPSSFRQPLLPDYSARLARPSDQAGWFPRVKERTLRASPFRLGDARAWLSHRIVKNPPLDPDILSLQQDRRNLASVSETCSLLDGMSAGEALVRHLCLSYVGSLGKANTLASEHPLHQLRLRGLDLTREGAPGASLSLAVPIDGAWPDRFCCSPGGQISRMPAKTLALLLATE